MGYDNKKSYNQYNKEYGERKNYTNKKPTETQGKESQKESRCDYGGCLVECSLEGEEKNQSKKV